MLLHSDMIYPHGIAIVLQDAKKVQDRNVDNCNRKLLLLQFYYICQLVVIELMLLPLLSLIWPSRRIKSKSIFLSDFLGLPCLL